MVLNKLQTTHLLEGIIKQMEEGTQFLTTKNYIQHGRVTVYDHCIEVARESCSIGVKRKLDLDYTQLIRGALLHDYFLYDWHDKDRSHRLHGFFHSGKAYRNAGLAVELRKLEGDIIKHHMFPLTVIPPHSKEAWVVCLADKICATKEIIHVHNGI